MSVWLADTAGGVLQLLATGAFQGDGWNHIWPPAVIALGVALSMRWRGFRRHWRPRSPRLKHHPQRHAAGRQHRRHDRPRGRLRRRCADTAT